jgi:diguanylate cyclase (GGDEF)-like protein
MSFTARKGARPVAPDDASTPTAPAALSSISVNDQRVSRQGSRLFAVLHPGQWALWVQPKRIIVYHLSFETLALVGMVYACVRAPAPGESDWFRFVALTLCATLHIQLSRRQEERRRSRKTKPQVYVDLTGIWSFPGVLVLPIHLALLLIVLSRAQRWFVARRQPHRFVFAAFSMMTAAAIAHTVVDLLGARGWVSFGALGSLSSFREFAVMIIAGLIYGGLQALFIGIVLALADSTATVRTLVGTKEDNELEALTIALGIVAAVLAVNLPAALVIMVAVGVIGNRIAEVRQLQVDVRTDPKTGLLNMRGWREVAEREMNRASRDEVPCALLMVDLDHFKNINDTWGHPAGDDVLEYVAHALRSATRPSDVIGRFGGEEFVLLLPDADTEEASAAGERIRQTISDLHVPTTDKRGGPVAISHRTTSVGVAVYPNHADALDQLLQAADAAVYEAKESGRNQVRLAG